MNWQPGMPVPPALQANIMAGAQSLLDVLPRDIAITLNRVNLCVVPAVGTDVHGKYDSSSNTLFLAHYMIKNFTPEQMRVTLWHEMGHWLYDKANGPGAHPRLKQWRADIEAHWQARIQGQPVAKHPTRGWRYVADSWIKAYVGRIYNGVGGLEIPSVYLEAASWGTGRLGRLCDRHSHNGHSTAQETFDIVLSILK